MNRYIYQGLNNVDEILEEARQARKDAAYEQDEPFWEYSDDDEYDGEWDEEDEY